MMAIEAPVIFFFILYGDHVIPRSRLFNEIKTPRLETERNEIIVKTRFMPLCMHLWIGQTHPMQDLDALDI